MGLLSWRIICLFWLSQGLAISVLFSLALRALTEGCPADLPVENHLFALSEQMRAYSTQRYVLYFLFPVYSACALLAVLQGGAARRLRDVAEKCPASGFGQILFYYASLVLFLLVLKFPLVFYGGYFLDHSFGLSHQSLGGWLLDLLKWKLIDIAVIAPVIILLFALVKRYPRAWGRLFFLCAVPIVYGAVLLTPLVVDPLFNRFSPVPDGHLLRQIKHLEEKAGISGASVYIVDSSCRKKTLNAYVTGIGPTAQVVLYDNLVRRLPEDEVLAIVSHEIAHYVLQHVYLGIALSVAGLLILEEILQKLAPAILSRLPRGWGIVSLCDKAIIPAILLGWTLLSFLAAPVINGCSRCIEQEADAYGLKLTGDRLATARSLTHLAQTNLSDPDPPAWIEFWMFSHPSLRKRIEFVLDKSRDYR